MSRRTVHEFIHAFDYPMYATEFVGRDSVIVAGGGGASKTGVPNRIDVASILHENETSCPTAKITGGLDTGTEAVMSISVSNVGGTGSFVISLEGHTCVEYSVVSKTAPSDDSIHAVESTALNSNHSQLKDIHSGRVVRKRKGSTKSRKPSANVTTDCLTPVDNAHPDTRESIRCEITKLRQFTIPGANLVAPQSPLSASISPSPSHTAAPSLSEILTCVTSGGPANFWFAIGSDCGSVFLFDRSRLVEEITESGRASRGNTMKPFFVYPDVSDGLKTGVCALALTTTTTAIETSTSNLPANESPDPLYDIPLLATICEQPCWNLVYLWAVCGAHPLFSTPLLDGSPSTVNYQQRRNATCKRKSVTGTTNTCSQNFFFSESVHDAEMTYITQPFALAAYSRISATEVMPPPSPRVAKRSQDSSMERSNYRFKHCQFLKSHLDPLSTYQMNKGKTNSASCFLVTTMQPLCANRRSVGRVIVWQVQIPTGSSSQSPNDHRSTKNSHSPLSLAPLTDIALPPGELPACLAVHPSRSRALVGVGTMEGRVEVYFLSPQTFTLSCVYSVKDAHPIFVTALTFLPVYESHSDPTEMTAIERENITKRHHLSNVRSEQSYELISVSVDRKLCWHSGPRSSQINRLAHGFPLDPVGAWARGLHFLQKMIMCYGLVFLFPILLSLVDRIFCGWF